RGFEAELVERVVEVRRVVEVGLLIVGGVPADVLLITQVVEIRDRHAVVGVDIYGQDGPSVGAAAREGRNQHLDLLVGQALDGDLAGGPGADRGDDGQAIGADGQGARALSVLRVAQAGDPLLPERTQLAQRVADRVGRGQADESARWLVDLEVV